MRADRLISLLLLLQNRGRMTAPELAAELEVSVRTVYRDVEALGASGVPVQADRGPAGGYRLTDGYRTRLTGLTDAQAGSLFLAGAPGPAEDLGLGGDLAAAQLKLQAALPAALAGRARRLQDRFHLDATAWFREADPVPHLAQLARAVWDQHTVRAHYRRWNGEVHRELCPLGLVLKGGIWYLVARPAAEEAVRTYRVGRFLGVDTLAEGFERPEGFALAAYWEESARRLEAGRHHQTAVARLSPRALRLLPMQFGAVGVRALAGAGPPDAEGWVRVELSVESRAVAVCDLLRLGTEAEVLGPPELRGALAEAVEVLAERYRARTLPTGEGEGRMGIVLREVRDSDLAVFWEQSTDPGLRRTAALTREYHYDRGLFDAHWAKVRSDPAVTVRTVVADGVAVGHAAVFGPPQEREVTYTIGPGHWGRGLATAALAELLLLEPARPLHAGAAADNAGSLRVLEKCGFKPTGHTRDFALARGEEVDVVLLTLD